MALHAVRWTISRARLRWKEARRLDCIDSLLRSSQLGWPSWNWPLANVLPRRRSGHEAVATRAAFEARSDGALEYFSPVSQTPGFPKALARTLLDLRLAAIASADLARLPRSGTDLAALLDRVDILLNEAGASDRAALFETATRALGSPVTGWPPMPLLLLDVPFESEIEAQFLWALIQQSPQVMITVPAGDASAVSQLGEARRATPDHRGSGAERSDPACALSVFKRAAAGENAARVNWCGFQRPAKAANASRSRAES